MFKHVFRGAAALAVAVLAATGCDDATGGETGRVTLLLADAPGDLAAVRVEIERIYLTGTPDGDTAGKVVLFEGSRLVDLLELRDGSTETLAGDLTVPAGSYSQLRFVIGEVTIVTEDGKTRSTADGGVKCPSCAQSGLKVKLPGGSMRIEEGENLLLLDFDVGQSFGRERGRSGKWVMTPVIRATRLDSADGVAITGTVSLAQGVTLPACGGGPTDLTAFVPQATAGETRLSGSTTADGTFRIGFVEDGSYALGFAGETEFDNGDVLTFSGVTATPASVTVAGADVSAAYTIGGATCSAAS